MQDTIRKKIQMQKEKTKSKQQTFETINSTKRKSSVKLKIIGIEDNKKSRKKNITSKDK